MSRSTPGGGGREDKRTWEGYADYYRVSDRYARAVSDATDSYHALRAAHVEGATVDPQLAAEARAGIKAAGMRLLPELERERDRNELYDEICERWLEGTDGGKGLWYRLDDVELRRQCPSWLFRMMRDIRMAAWELGYIKAGREERDESLSDDDETDRQVREMFKT